MKKDNSTKAEAPKPVKPNTTEYSKKSAEPGNLVVREKPSTIEYTSKWETSVDLTKKNR